MRVMLVDPKNAAKPGEKKNRQMLLSHLLTYLDRQTDRLSYYAPANLAAVRSAAPVPASPRPSQVAHTSPLTWSPALEALGPGSPGVLIREH